MNTLQKALAIGLLLGLGRGVIAQESESHEDVDLIPEGPFRLGEAIDDRAIAWKLIQAGEELIREARNVPAQRLLEHAGRSKCQLSFKRPANSVMASQRLLTEHRRSVLVLGHIFKCEDCSRYHVRTDSGFMLTSSGAFATCFHSLKDKRVEAIIGMTGDGRVAPVVDLLAANAPADVVIMKLDGDGYTPFPVERHAPVGSAVRVISHPDRDYFMLTSGFVSRYSVEYDGSEALTRMSISADFAKGSSGAPVLNDQGAVVGVVLSTRPVYYTAEPGKNDNLQMVIKHCVPSSYLWELIASRSE